MPNIPPHVAYFPQVYTPSVPTSKSIFATLQGEDSPGADLTGVTASGGLSASAATGSVVLSNTGIRKIVGAGGIGAPYNEAQEETEISCPAINNVAGVLRTFTPLAFGTAQPAITPIAQGSDVNLYTITLPVASTYCKMTLCFAAGTRSQDPVFYTDTPVGVTENPFVIYLSYLNSTGTPPTNIPVYLSPNSYVFNYVDLATQDPVTLNYSGGTFMPNITLQMTSPNPVNTWYVNMAHLGPVDANLRVIWNYQTIAPSVSTARAENVVSESVVTPD